MLPVKSWSATRQSITLHSTSRQEAVTLPNPSIHLRRDAYRINLFNYAIYRLSIRKICPHQVVRSTRSANNWRYCRLARPTEVPSMLCDHKQFKAPGGPLRMSTVDRIVTLSWWVLFSQALCTWYSNRLSIIFCFVCPESSINCQINHIKYIVSFSATTPQPAPLPSTVAMTNGISKGPDFTTKFHHHLQQQSHRSGKYSTTWLIAKANYWYLQSTRVPTHWTILLSAFTASPLIQSPSASSVATTNSSGASSVTNAVVVVGGGGKQHGVGAGNNIHTTATAAAVRHNNNHTSSNSSSGDMSGGQLEGNPVTRLRSSDSFRYNSRIMIVCAGGYCLMSHKICLEWVTERICYRHNWGLCCLDFGAFPPTHVLESSGVSTGGNHMPKSTVR